MRCFVLIAAWLAGFTIAANAVETPTAISVADFTNTAKAAELDWLTRGLADMIATDLTSIGTIKIVERRDLQKVIKEQDLALTGLIDEKTAPKIGQLVGASHLIYGSFLVAGGTLRIDAKVVNASTSVVAAGTSVQGPPTKALDLEAELLGKLAAAFGLTRPSPKNTESLEAAKAYYVGLVLFDSGQYDAAIARFQEASRYDPLYAKPRASIEESYKFLKDFKRQRQAREMNALIADIEAMRARLAAPVFWSFASAITDPRRFGFKDAAAVSAAFQARPRVWAGDTPMQAMWNLQHLYLELGDMGLEQNEDRNLKDRCTDAVATIARTAETRFPTDPFLPEVLYSELFGFREREQWAKLKAACERLMTNYPDFRMMWAIEDFYEKSLDELKAAEKARR